MRLKCIKNARSTFGGEHFWTIPNHVSLSLSLFWRDGCLGRSSCELFQHVCFNTVFFGISGSWVGFGPQKKHRWYLCRTLIYIWHIKYNLAGPLSRFASKLVYILDGRNGAIVSAESLARVIATIQITSVSWWSCLSPKHRHWSLETLRALRCVLLRCDSNRAIGVQCRV